MVSSLSSLGAYLLLAALLLGVASRAVRRLRRAEKLWLAAAPLLVVGPALVGGRVFAPIDQYGYFAPAEEQAGASDSAARPEYYQFDVFTKFVPWRAAARAALAAGSPPVWNPGLHCGDPLLGASEPALAHPFVLASLLLPLPAGFGLVAGATLLLAVTSGYLLGRELVRRRSAAWLGALAWMGSDFLLFWLQYPVGLTVAGLPLTALALLRLARGGGRRGLLLAAAALALQLLGGHPESALAGAAAAALLALCGLRRPLARSAPRFVVRLALAGALGAGLAAVSLLPSLGTVRQSAEHEFRRGVYAAERRSVDWATAARRWAPNLVPALYGRPGVEERADRPEFQPPAGLYCGSALLALALLGGAGRTLRPLRLGALAILLAGSLVAAKAPGLADLVAAVPLFDVSIPEYFLVWSALGVAVLVALGAARLGRGGRAVAAPVLIALGALGAAAALAWPAMRAAGLSGGFVGRATAELLLPAAAAALVLLAPLAPRRQAGLLIAIFAVQRLVEMGPLARSFAPELLERYQRQLEVFPDEAAPYRIVATGERVIPNSATLAGLEDPRGYTALTLKEYAETFPLWSQGRYPLANRIEELGGPFLSLLNVKYAAVGRGDAVPAGWRERPDLGPARILENEGVLPRAFLPARIVACAERPELMRRLAAERDFAAVGYLERGAEPCAERPNGAGAVVARRAPRGLDLEARLASEGWIVVSQTAWAGWVADSDRGRLEIARANGALLAIRAPAGASRIRLRFAPAAVPLGLGISIAAVALLLVGWRGGANGLRIRSRAEPTAGHARTAVGVRGGRSGE